MWLEFGLLSTGATSHVMVRAVLVRLSSKAAGNGGG